VATLHLTDSTNWVGLMAK